MKRVTVNRLSLDKIVNLLLLSFSMLYLYHAFYIPSDPTVFDENFTSSTFPISLAIISIIVAVIKLLLPDNSPSNLSMTIAGLNWKPTLGLIALLAIYAISFNFLGFVLATVLFLSASFYWLGERRLKLVLMVSCGITLSFWLILSKLFKMYLDSGDLIRWLVD